MTHSGGGQYRRSPTVIVYWRRNRLLAREYGSGVESGVTTAQLAILAALDVWTSLDALRKSVRQLSASEVRASLEHLVAEGFVDRSDRSPTRTQAAMKSWQSWGPEATFFHFGTKGGAHIGLERATQELELKRRLTGAPKPLKENGRGHRVVLPPISAAGPVAKVLLQRRSWRRFAPRPVTLRDLSTLLGLTWGVQQWVTVAPGVRSALKTSPSGGACHSIEAYLVAQSVESLQPGIYHYCPERHSLTKIHATAEGAIGTLLRQPWFAASAAAIVMTSVWERVQWKYGFPRAYRTVLLEAGHFAQTFCLVATWLGLAPFCSGAFDDHAIEQALEIDGVAEGAVYVTGVGTRPAGVTWAPWPEVDRTPQTSEPAHRKRRAPPARRRS